MRHAPNAHPAQCTYASKDGERCPRAGNHARGDKADLFLCEDHNVELLTLADSMQGKDLESVKRLTGFWARMKKSAKATERLTEGS